MLQQIKKLILISLGFGMLACSATKKVAQKAELPSRIAYELRMPEPHTHYFDVTMKMSDVSSAVKNGKLLVRMAAWTPGSYLIREYAKNVEGFTARTAGRVLPSRKVAKNVWEISVGNATDLTVDYSVYAYELSVRTSFIDQSHGYINGASVFMYVNEWMQNPMTLKIFPHENWKSISTALKSVGEQTYRAEDIDELFDSPIEIGNQELLTFDASGVKHTIANYSMVPLNFDKAKVLDAYKRVVEASTSIVGTNPCKEYLFIIHHLPNIGGGLEHKFSTTCQTSPTAYDSDRAFKGFMGLIAHEYFHLWNVKRIRPMALGPFDYENENYTHMLWVSEGFTSYYQEDILRRAGLYTPAELLTKLAANINTIESQPGQAVQSVAESSWDAWIKFYRPNENSINSNISYYTKGGVLGMLLNLEILKATKGEKSMDDVFRFLWKEYYLKHDRGFTDLEYKQAVEKIAGRKFDTFFDNYVYGTTPINYQEIFNGTGILVANAHEGNPQPFLGINARKGVVTSVVKGSGAYKAGLNVNDEILEINGKPYSELERAAVRNTGRDNVSMADILPSQLGDIHTFKVRRFGTVQTIQVPIGRTPYTLYDLKINPNVSGAEKKIQKEFLHL